MTLMENLARREIKELLVKCWMTHDAMWFANALFTHGIDEANRLNRAAIKSMVDIELGRFLRAMNLAPDQVRRFEAFKAFFQSVQELLIPDFMNVSIAFKAPDTLSWQFNEKGCFAYNGVKRLKVENGYQCGVLYRIQCWLTYLDIPFEMSPAPRTCLMAEQGRCRGRFRCDFV
jgi:hypothetical protein